MATLDWSQCPAVESVPGRLSGAWVFRDTRMPVSAVFENPPAAWTQLPFRLAQLPLPMRIIFDHVTPRVIARVLTGHAVTKAKEMGWDTLANGNPCGRGMNT